MASLTGSSLPGIRLGGLPNGLLAAMVITNHASYIVQEACLGRHSTPYKSTIKARSTLSSNLSVALTLSSSIEATSSLRAKQLISYEYKLAKFRKVVPNTGVGLLESICKGGPTSSIAQLTLFDEAIGSPLKKMLVLMSATSGYLASLTVATELSSTISATSNLVSGLSVDKPISASIHGQSGLRGNLCAVNLSSTISAQSDMSCGLDVVKALSVQFTGTSDLVASMRAIRGLSSILSGQSSLNASLTNTEVPEYTTAIRRNFTIIQTRRNLVSQNYRRVLYTPQVRIILPTSV